MKMFTFNLQKSISLIALVVLVISCSVIDAKLLSSRRFFKEPYGDVPYGAMATGERAIMTIRGARNPYDGSVPARLTIEDDPYRGPMPRGIYDRLDMGGRGGMPYGGGYPMGGYPMGGGYMNRPYGGGSSMYGAPARIAVTGAYPYAYGSRYF